MNRLGIKYNTVFACDWDKYARQTYIHNYGEPDYYPMDVYDREIPKESLDIYMTSPPCQAFSLAGKRKGEEDKRGVLFYNSHEFIQVNKPRYFIFENVKGLLSDDSGKTFRRWVEYLGGKSINGNPIIFPHPESVPYHIYWKVLNAKNYNIPQNRERVFIVGIRDDEDNNFTWPKEIFLEKRLRDVLESDVDEKYYLSDKILNGFINHTEKQRNKGNGFKFDPKSENEVGNTVTARCFKMGVDDNYIKVNVVGNLPGNHEQNSRVYGVNGVSPSLTTMQGGGQEPKIIQRGRGNNKGGEHDICPTITTNSFEQNNHVKVVAFGRSEEEKQRRREHFQKTGKDSGSFKDKELVLKDQTFYDTLLASPNPKKEGLIAVNEVVQFNQEPQTFDVYRIRRITTREAFRLMDFPDTFTWPVSDRQAYKQSGNSICVGVLAGIISKLNI